VNFKFEEKYKLREGEAALTEEQLGRIPSLRLALKNAVMHHLN